MKKIIGVLAFQGNFMQHANLMREIGCNVILIKNLQDIKNIDALIIPGGESTVISNLIQKTNMKDAIIDFSLKKPILGTCAGAILMSKEIVPTNSTIVPLNIIPIVVERNFYGPQINSEKKEMLYGNNKKAQSLFIRAPKIVNVSDDVEIICRVNDEQNTPCGVMYNGHIALTFHPESYGIKYFHEFII